MSVTFTVPDTKLLRPRTSATKTRDLINISSQFVHSAASRPKQMVWQSAIFSSFLSDVVKKSWSANEANCCNKKPKK